ncbi:MAG: ATP-binding domain-containing protein [Phototrophicaceae bacterium]
MSWDMQTEMNMAIKVCSIYSYKGLESSVVILTELDKLHEDVARQLLYVGLSRARNHAVILGDLPTPEELDYK